MIVRTRTASHPTRVLGRLRPSLAVLLGWRDTVSSHRLSHVGPMWIFLQTFAWVFFIGTLFDGLLSEGAADYLVYVAIGMLAFNMMTLLVSDTTNTFVRDAALLKNIPVPPATYVLRVGAKAVFTFLIELPVVLIAFALKDYWPGVMEALHSLAGLALTLFAFLGLGFGLASLGALVRDLIPAVSVANRLAFFATPIFWVRDATDPVREFLSLVNPLAHFMRIVRGPLIDQPPTGAEWLVCLGLAAAFWVFGLSVFSRVRDRLPALV